MNIAVFTKNTTLHDSFGGLETQNAVLCEGLVGEGHNVTVFSPSHYIKESKGFKNGVSYVFVDCKYKMGWILGFGGFLDKKNWVNRSVEEFKKVHSKEKFNIVIGQSSAALGILKERLKLNIKVISIAHGTILSEYKTYVSEIRDLKGLVKLIPNTGYVLKNFFSRQREMAHSSAKIIAVSNFVRTSFIDETFVEDDKVVTIHNGIKPVEDSVPESPTKNKRFEILYVGRLERSKGVNILVDLMCDPEFKDFHLTFVGDGPIKLSLQLGVSDLKIDHKVSFLGKVPHNKIHDLMRSSDLFVLPTLRIEGFPMTLVEAMFAKLPIIASDMGGISDAIEDNSTGYLVVSGDKALLKQKILMLATDISLRKKFADAAYQKATGEYTSDVMISKYMEVIKEVTK